VSREDQDDVTETLPALSDEEAPPAEETAHLIVLTGSQIGTMVQVKDGLVIGRGSDAGLMLPDDGVSRQHVRIKATPDGALIAEDLGSRNGMYVNGRRTESRVLKDGDKIRIGSTTILKFSHADKLEQSFQRQMHDAALIDPLTQIYNRRSLDDHILREFAFATRHGAPLSLILADIDHFKHVNDGYGHLVGDAVLAGLARLLTKSIRQEDFLARYGGEEFALVCRQTPGITAFSIAHRLRCSTKESALVAERPKLRISLSAGVCAIPDSSIGRIDQFIEGADRALYEAKNSGRDRICLRTDSGRNWLFDED
jgi:diguanylate cyclase (GGDEF)-like protein